MLIEIKNLSKNFGGLTVLNDLSFNVPEGQLTSIIGPNGAGKTTLFNVISGRFPPTSGRILFRGEDIGGLKPYVISQRSLDAVLSNHQCLWLVNGQGECTIGLPVPVKQEDFFDKVCSQC